MYMDGTFVQPGGLGDFPNTQVFHKSKNEDRALPFGKSPCRFPNSTNLLVDRCSFFRGHVPVGPITDLVCLNALCSLPELNTAASQMITSEIDCDPHEPRMHTAFAAKRFAAPVRIQEAVLCQ